MGIVDMPSKHSLVMECLRTQLTFLLTQVLLVNHFDVRCEVVFEPKELLTARLITLEHIFHGVIQC